MASQADFFRTWVKAEKIMKRRSKDGSYDRQLIDTSNMLLRANALVQASGIDPKDNNAQVPGLDAVIRDLKDFIHER